jgi:hypothetical protein
VQAQHAESFPRALQSYEEVDGIWATLTSRVSAAPFNLVATLIFLLAIIHTFLRSVSKALATALRTAYYCRPSLRCGSSPC